LALRQARDGLAFRSVRRGGYWVSHPASTRAGLEDVLGNAESALSLQKTAIRFGYAKPEPRVIAIRHRNLANYLQAAGSAPASQRAHRLAATLIYRLTGMTHDLAQECEALALDLRQAPGLEHLPATVDQVIAVAEQTEGVHLGELIDDLTSDRQAAAVALTQILDTAASMPSGQDVAIQQLLQQWEPVIALTVAAAGGDTGAAVQLTPLLDKLAQAKNGAALGAVLRRILGGERRENLLNGLDPVATAFVGEIIARLTLPDTRDRQ